MATRLTRLLKKDVVAMAEGRNLGPPNRILIDPVRHRVAAVVMVSHPVRELSVYFRASAVVSFDSDTLAVEALSHLHVAAADEFVLGLLAQRRMHDRSVVSSEGREMGHITEATFDAEGNVLEYWVRRKRFGRVRPRLKIHPDALTAAAGHLAVVDHESLTGNDEPAQPEGDDPQPTDFAA
jgi:uncharacterized protein YrrD